MKSDIVNQIKLNRICDEIIKTYHIQLQQFNNITWVNIDGRSVGVYYNDKNEVIMDFDKFTGLFKIYEKYLLDVILNNMLNILLHTNKRIIIYYC